MSETAVSAFWFELCGRPVPARNTADGIRAVSRRVAVTAECAETCLETKVGDDLVAAPVAMTTLAHAYPPQALAADAFFFYEAFRPVIPEGVKDWVRKAF
jgi:hypothetical protein